MVSSIVLVKVIETMDRSWYGERSIILTSKLKKVVFMVEWQWRSHILTKECRLGPFKKIVQHSAYVTEPLVNVSLSSSKLCDPNVFSVGCWLLYLDGFWKWIYKTKLRANTGVFAGFITRNYYRKHVYILGQKYKIVRNSSQIVNIFFFRRA